MNKNLVIFGVKEGGNHNKKLKLSAVIWKKNKYINALEAENKVMIQKNPGNEHTKVTGGFQY